MTRRKKRVTSVAFTGAAAAIAMGAVTPQAHASAPKFWHIRNGGFSFRGDVKGKIDGTITIKDHTTGAAMTCRAGTLTANVPVSKVASGGTPVIAVVSGVSLSSCTIDGIINDTVAKKPMTPKIALHARGYAAPVTTGFLGSPANATAISLAIAGVGNNCAATVHGSSLPISYNNINHVLTMDAARTVTMKIQGAANCGLFHTGDTAYISGKYAISFPSKLTVSLA